MRGGPPRPGGDSPHDAHHDHDGTPPRGDHLNPHPAITPLSTASLRVTTGVPRNTVTCGYVNAAGQQDYKRGISRKLTPKKPLTPVRATNSYARGPPTPPKGFVLNRTSNLEGSATDATLVGVLSRPPATSPEGPGFITCGKTVREYSFKFPTADECRSGAQSVGSWEWNGREGIVPQIEVAPGLIRLTAPDLNRREKTLNGAADQPGMAPANDDDQARIDAHRAELAGLGVLGDDDPRMITSWSRRSRARMVSSMAELDLAPLLMGGDDPAMITLTYPGDWEVVAPDGEAVKAHLQAFFKRFSRAWGRDWVGVWKMEFQRRGAPHFHLLMGVPDGVARAGEWADYQVKLAVWESSGRAGRKPYWRSLAGDGLPFRQWLSAVWADVVAHPDPVQRMNHEAAGTGVDYAEGDRARDPKRAAIYFGKHGSFAAKDYQHEVPELWKESGKSVGRFWGYRGLSKVKGAATLDVDTMIFLGRVLRGYGTRTRVWNPSTLSHEFRPALVTKIRARRTVSADGTVKQARDKDTGELLFDDEGNPVDHLRLRKTTVRAKRMTGKMGAGFLLVNDGPAMARVLARAIEACRTTSEVLPVGMRGPVIHRVVG